VVVVAVVVAGSASDISPEQDPGFQKLGCLRRVLVRPVTYVGPFSGPLIDETHMGRNRMTVEKHQRDAKKKRKAEEKRAMRRKKKEEAQTETEPTDERPSIDEPTES
jgi:hypothetical protein